MTSSKNNQTPAHFLCKLSDLDDLSCKSFQVKQKRQLIDLFIVRKDDQVYAYKNICPHAQAPLEWNPDEFLDESKENIICALHGAKFSIEAGECQAGPCAGVGLSSVALDVSDGEIFVRA